MYIVKRLLLATIVIGSANVWAGPADTPNVDQRQIEQQQRIGQGVQSGSLTAGEAVRLEKGQAHVQAVENRAKADGVVTPAERAHLQHAQNVQSRRIAQEKHDRRHR